MASMPLSAAASTNDKPPRRRRWMPLSLRLFVVILLLLGSGSTLALTIWIPYFRQQQVSREINRWGIGQYYAPRSGGPDWLRRLLGNDRIEKIEAFGRVKGVMFEGLRFDDTKLAYLSQWTSVENFSLVGTSV